MATIHTLINYDRQNPTAISREQYTDVGSAAFAPGTFPRAFNDLEVWDSPSGGVQLVLDTDYEYAEVDYELSAANFEGEAVYKKLRVINATYQTGSIYLTYSAIGSYPTAYLIRRSPPSVKSASHTILDDDADVFEFSGASGDGTFTLPTLADNLGRVIELHNVDATHKATLDGEGAETIDGNASVVLPSQYNYLKVRAGTAGWHILGMRVSYSTGWVNISDWTDVQLVVAHGISADLSDLIVKFFISLNGTEDGAFEPILIHKEAAASGQAKGVTIYQTSTGTIFIQLGLNGVMFIDSADAAEETMAAQDAYYKVKVYYLGT